MIELTQPPAEVPNELVRRLAQLQLCRPADFRRARASVRRLYRDLPAFDSVWIDALVQLRRLTPYQARLLEAGAAEELLIGQFVVLDELGRGPNGVTLLARPLGRREQVVVKRLAIPVELVSESRLRLAQLIEQSRQWTHPHLVVPHGMLDTVDVPVVVSRWVPGLTLSELLVRRGRFPAVTVLEIARQLVSGLAALHGLGLVHGDIRLANVRLTGAGAAVLVDAGIRPAVFPELTIHQAQSLEACDGVAPELIGTGIGANAASEMYALGCLLWHLLAGRPPYAVADRLMKLAAHQTERIPDVRVPAPDTPEALAETIHSMTSPDANARPRAFDDLLQVWGRPGAASRRRLKRYRRHFDGAVPHFAQPGELTSAPRWPWLAVSLFVALGMAISLADNGLRGEVLAIPRRVANALQPSRDEALVTKARPGTGTVSSNDPSKGGLLPLPPAAADGQIVLAERGPYGVARVVFQGKLTIRGAPGINPEIHVSEESLWLAADAITLENLTVICHSSAKKGAAAMALMQSNELKIHNCVFHRLASSDDPDVEASRNLAALAWRPMETDLSNSSWNLEIQNTVFRQTGVAVWSAELPHRVTLSNCLKLGAGACVAVSPRAAAHTSSFDLRQLTIRDGGPLLRLAGALAEQVDVPTIELTAHDCIFAPAARPAGLIELHTSQPRSDARQSVRMTGRGSVMLPGTMPLSVVDSVRQSTSEVADVDEQFEGIVVSDLQFAGPASEFTAGARLLQLTAPRSAADPRPGVDIDRLPPGN